MNITERIKSPDHPFWSKVANIAAKVVGPAGTLAILIFVPAPYKDQAVAVWVALTSAIVGGTKLTKA